jgi:MscS family membrane protein
MSFDFLSLNSLIKLGQILLLAGIFFILSNYLLNYLLKKDKLPIWQLFFIEAIKKPLNILIIIFTLSEIWELYQAGKRQQLEVFTTIALATWSLLAFIKKLEKYYLKFNSFSNHKDKEAKKSTIVLTMKLCFVMILLLGGIMILQTVGVEMQAIIAFVSLSGVTLGIASRDLVAGLFGTMMIYTTRPFVIGDRIKINLVEGLVEDISWLSTRVRLDNKKLAYVPNIQFLMGAVENVSKASYRRLALTLQIFLYDINELIKVSQEILDRLEIFNRHNHFYYEIIEANEARIQIKYSIYLDRDISQKHFIRIKNDCLLIVETILIKKYLRFNLKFED